MMRKFRARNKKKEERLRHKKKRDFTDFYPVPAEDKEKTV